MELSSIKIDGQQTEEKPPLSMNEASSSSSNKGKEKEVVPEEDAKFQNTSSQGLISQLSDRIEKKLKDVREKTHSAQCLLPFPTGSINSRYLKPEIVSIGPRPLNSKDNDLDCTTLKWFLRERFISRREAKDKKGVTQLLVRVQDLEPDIKAFYSAHTQISGMPRANLFWTMLLDGSFLIELLLCLKQDQSVIDDPIMAQPYFIPIIARDVLKLENQLPLCVLISLSGEADKKFMELALEFFNQFWTGPRMTLPSDLPKCNHLLDLFYWSSVKPLSVNHSDQQPCALTHSVTELKQSRIKFKERERKAVKTFLDIKYKNRVLQIPAITFNEMMKTVLTNCVALEQSPERHIKYFCNYVSFLSCLISQPEDVSSLSLDGIISKFSEDDKAVASFINDLRGNMGCVRDSYLSDEIRNVEAYYSSDFASLMRNYFVTKWTVIGVLAASLILVFTFIQTLMSVLSYIRELNK